MEGGGGGECRRWALLCGPTVLGQLAGLAGGMGLADYATRVAIRVAVAAKQALCVSTHTLNTMGHHIG